MNSPNSAEDNAMLLKEGLLKVGKRGPESLGKGSNNRSNDNSRLLPEREYYLRHAADDCCS